MPCAFLLPSVIPFLSIVSDTRLINLFIRPSYSMLHCQKHTSSSQSTKAILRVCSFTLLYIHVLIHRFPSFLVFFNALLAMLNAREKLSKSSFGDSKNGLPHSYVLSSTSGSTSSGSWGKFANVFRLPGIGFLKSEKVTSGEKLGSTNRHEPISSARSGRWGAGGRTSGLDLDTIENAYPMSITGTKRNDKVSSILAVINHDASLLIVAYRTLDNLR